MPSPSLRDGLLMWLFIPPPRDAKPEVTDLVGSRCAATLTRLSSQPVGAGTKLGRGALSIHGTTARCM